MDKYKYPLIVLLVGVILIGIGIFFSKFNNYFSETKVEILGESDTIEAGNNSQNEEAKITVEVAGEVIKPGVYEFVLGSRINELLTMAGGFSAEADREWVEKNINLAQKLTDGGKVYIPKITNMANKSNSSNSSNLSEGKININNSSEAELDTLPGIGPATAQKIISGRSYQKIEELIERKIISNKVLEQIKDKVTVY